MSIQLAQRLITVGEYRKMAEAGILTSEDRVELLEGKIIQMSPIGSRHAACVNLIVKVLNQLYEDDAIVRAQNPVILDEYSEPEPDIAVLKPSDNFYADHHPTSEDVFLIIEVADTSIEKDREVKAPLYAAAGIPEYWIVDLAKSEIEVYRSPLQDQYKLREIFTTAHELLVPGLEKKIALKKLLV